MSALMAETSGSIRRPLLLVDLIVVALDEDGCIPLLGQGGGEHDRRELGRWHANVAHLRPRELHDNELAIHLLRSSIGGASFVVGEAGR